MTVREATRSKALLAAGMAAVVDSKGDTVYLFEKDESDESYCRGLESSGAKAEPGGKSGKS